MSETLHKNAQRVQQALQQQGLTCRVVELPDSTRSAQEAADTIGCELGQIAKSLIFRSGEQPILFIISGPNRLHEKKAKRSLELDLERADANWVKAQTGFPIGGIPPLGHACNMQVYLDPALLTYASIWAAAGTPNAVFEIEPQQLHAITNASMLDAAVIKQPS